MRLCRRQYPFSACLPCLLCLTRLENDDFTCETGLELSASTFQYFRTMLLVLMSEKKVGKMSAPKTGGGEVKIL